MDTGTILVTGGMGFIGRRVVEGLIARGMRTRIFSPGRMPVDPPEGAEIERGDIRDPAAVRRAMRDTLGVIHAAAVSAWSSDPSYFYEVNVAGTRNVLQAALSRGSVPFVHISSCSAVEFRGEGLLDESAIIPRTRNLTEYGRSKALAEREVESAARRGLDTVIVYPTRVFGAGPRGESNAATRALALYLDGTLKVLPGGGTAYANWGYVNDIARGVVGAFLRGTTGERYLLGGENMRLRDVIALADEILGSRHRPLLPIPLGAGRFLAFLEEWRARLTRTPPRITRTWYDGLFEETRISCAKAMEQIGYSVTPIREALENVLL